MFNFTFKGQFGNVRLPKLMSREFQEREAFTPRTIEICGTPFSARYKFLVHNGIEDMITERLDKKIRGAEGIEEDVWPVTVNERTEYVPGHHQVLIKIQKLLGVNRFDASDPFLIQEGAFQAMAMTEVMKKAKILSPQDAENHLWGLLPYVQMEDFIVLTLVRPRAVLSREMYPPELEGYQDLMRRKFIFFTVFNEAAETILEQFHDELPQVELIKPSGDEFQRNNIFFANANAVFRFLELPTIEEWSEELIKNPNLKGRGGVKSENVTPSTTAGLTTNELKEYLRRKDWSIDQAKRDRVTNITFQILQALADNNLFP